MQALEVQQTCQVQHICGYNDVISTSVLTCICCVQLDEGEIDVPEE